MHIHRQASKQASSTHMHPSIHMHAHAPAICQPTQGIHKQFIIPNQSHHSSTHMPTRSLSLCLSLPPSLSLLLSRSLPLFLTLISAAIT